MDFAFGTGTEKHHRAWGVELMRAWHHFNDLYLGGGLRPPVLAISASESQLGTWRIRDRTLSISAAHILADSWLDVLATLRHEMAHQYADEVLKSAQERPHGRAFAYACKKLWVSASASRGEVKEPERGTILQRIVKLLALGESPNENESKSALRKAHELLLRHNIDSVELEDRGFSWRHLGPARKRHHEYEYNIASLLAEHFFVESIWTNTYLAADGKPATVLEIHGTEENLAFAEYVHGFLTSVLEPLWSEHKKRQGIQRNRDRLRFFAGVTDGFWQSLSHKRDELQREGLVWRGDGALRQHLRVHYPHISTLRVGGGSRSDAFEAGAKAGNKVRIRRPIGTEKTRFGGFLSR